MNKVIERLQEALDEQADWNLVVTVSRKDLQLLIKAYEQLRENTVSN